MVLLNLSCYLLGWLLFALLQAQNSVRSTANGLEGWRGLNWWAKLQGVNLFIRAGASAVFYPVAVQSMTAKVAAAGFALSAAGVCALAGFTSNGMLYQFFGFVPQLRVEVQDLAPPKNGGGATP
jgi:hypothetical protein